MVPVLRGGNCIRRHEPFPGPHRNPWPTHMSMNVVREISAKKTILKKTPTTIYCILYLVPGTYLGYTRACCTRVCTVLAMFVLDVLRALGIVRMQTIELFSARSWCDVYVLTPCYPARDSIIGEPCHPSFCCSMLIYVRENV